MPELDQEEQLAMDRLMSVVSQIESWGLRANHQELVQAVHIVQAFIVQHMLQRLAPDKWGQWYQ